tara:strand:- start:46 stop:336 length:291 start_codon:yes stop_codon:yes gene_type:complete
MRGDRIGGGDSNNCGAGATEDLRRADAAAAASTEPLRPRPGVSVARGADAPPGICGAAANGRGRERGDAAEGANDGIVATERRRADAAAACNAKSS